MSGRVLRGGQDSVPLRGNWAVLHRVTRNSGGPVDSVRTNGAGRYSIVIPRARASADSSAVYIISTSYDSLGYFSTPFNVLGRPAVSVEDLVVYRATTGTPPITLARRLVTVAKAAQDGTRDVLEILELENSGVTTRITNDTLHPTWAGTIPRGAIQFRGGQGDISPDAMKRVGDSVFVLGPIPPGQIKQLSYAYVLPAGDARLDLQVDQITKELNLLIEDTTAVVTAPKLEPLGVRPVEERSFAAYRAPALAPGDHVTIDLPRGAVRPLQLVPYVIGLVGAAMIAALIWALLRKPLAPVQPAP